MSLLLALREASSRQGQSQRSISRPDLGAMATKGAGLGPVLLERRDRRTLEHRTVDVESRAVTRAVPAAFCGVEPQQASKMCTPQGNSVKPTLLVAVDTAFTETTPHDARLAARYVGSWPM
jgi:hypothetical protein